MMPQETETRTNLALPNGFFYRMYSEIQCCSNLLRAHMAVSYLLCILEYNFVVILLESFPFYMSCDRREDRKTPDIYETWMACGMDSCKFSSRLSRKSTVAV